MNNSRRGFTLLELLIVIALLAIVIAIAIPNLMAARKSANEASAVGGLKTISTAEGLFRDGDKEDDGNVDYGMLSELSNMDLIDVVLGSGTKAGYLMRATYSFTSSEFLWFGVATPALAGGTGDRYFAMNHAGGIFFTSGAQLQIDTSSCLLPNNGVVPVGK